MRNKSDRVETEHISTHRQLTVLSNFLFHKEWTTEAKGEHVDVSQRGQTSPSVSIITARQVSLSDPHSGLPFWIRGDAPLPL